MDRHGGAWPRSCPLHMADVVWIGEPRGAPDGVTRCFAPPRPYPALDLRPGVVDTARLDVLHFPANTGWIRRGPIPTVLTIQDTIFLSTSFRSGRSARQLVGHRYAAVNVRRAIRLATRVVVPTQSTASSVRNQIRGAPPLATIPWAVELPGIPPEEPPASPQEEYLLAFAAPDPRKRLDLVFEAWEQLAPDTGIQLRPGRCRVDPG